MINIVSVVIGYLIAASPWLYDSDDSDFPIEGNLRVQELNPANFRLPILELPRRRGTTPSAVRYWLNYQRKGIIVISSLS